MKTFISLLLLSLSLSANAQKIRFTDSRNEWVTYGQHSGDAATTITYKFFADTFAFGRIYKHMRNTPFFYYCSPGSACPGPFSGHGVDYLIREDTITGKVYYRDIGFLIDTFEHLLFNYNFTIGDTIRFDSYTDTVAAVDSTIINGVYHKFITMRNPVHGRNYYVLEGIGTTNSPVFPVYFGSFFEYGESLTCFSQSGLHPFINNLPVGMPGNFITYCCSIYAADTFNNLIGCASLLSTQNILPMNPVISVFPNPVTDNIKITSSTPLDNNTFISIYDFTGRGIYNTKADNKTVITINTSAWADGLYIIIIQNNTGILKKEKVVIMK